jgi:hypothetical protein
MTHRDQDAFDEFYAKHGRLSFFDPRVCILTDEDKRVLDREDAARCQPTFEADGSVRNHVRWALDREEMERLLKRHGRALGAAGYTMVTPPMSANNPAFYPLRSPDGREVSIQQAIREIGAPVIDPWTGR